MNSRLACLLIASLLMGLGIACKSKKIASSTPPPPPIEVASKPNETEVLLDKINANSNQFSFFQARGTASYKDGKQTTGFDVNVVMEKDRYIWISITAVLGIEVARMYITADSVQLLDRLHRKYICAEIGYLQHLANAPLKLSNLQQLFVGNTLFNNSVQKSVVDTILGQLAVTTLLNAQKQYTVYDNNFKVLKGSVVQMDQSREFKYSYEKFARFGQNNFPSHMNINIRAEKNIECTLELTNFVFDKKREIQFTVPSNYEVVKP